MDKIRSSVLIYIVMAVLLLSGCSLSKAESLYKEGKQLYEEGRYEEACEKYIDAISRNRQSGHFFIDYGHALLKLGNYSEALANFSYAIVEEQDIAVVTENNKRALRGAGIACFMLEDYATAEDYLERALAVDALEEFDRDILYYLVCSRAEQIGTCEKGTAEFMERMQIIEQNYEKLLEFEQDLEARLELMHILSDVYMLCGDYEKAKNAIDETIAAGVEPDVEIYIKLATCNIMRKSYSEAEVCIYKALQLDDGTRKAEIESLRELMPSE